MYEAYLLNPTTGEVQRVGTHQKYQELANSGWWSITEQEYYYKLSDNYRDQNVALKAQNAKLISALEHICELAENAQGDWVAVDLVYLPEEMRPFREIEVAAIEAEAQK